MSGLVDGIFNHVEGSSPRNVAERMIDGRLNVRLDDPFGLTFEEMNDKIERLKKRQADAEHRAMVLADEVQRAEEEKQQLLAARQQFYETGEIDPSLIPECSGIHASERQSFNRETLDAAEQTLSETVEGEGWEIDRRRADDEFVYITVKRRREEFDEQRVEQRPVKAQLVQRVREVIEAHRDAIIEFSVHRSPRKPAAP